MRTIAIGDIHGHTVALDAIIEAVQPTPDDLLIFLGDYVDRGPDSKGVIDRLLEWQQRWRMVCLRGNHELMMERSRTDRSELKMWLSVGGTQTLASYLKPGQKANLDAVPEEHWTFLTEGLFDFFETETHIFVHANLNPALPLEEQTEENLFWDFLEGEVVHCSGKIMVCGHTSDVQEGIRSWPKTICLDSGIYKGGFLSAMDMATREFWQADEAGKVLTGRM